MKKAAKRKLEMSLTPFVPLALAGKGWQTRMNAALRDWLKTHSPA